MDILRELILNTEKRSPELQLEILESAARTLCPGYLDAIGYNNPPEYENLPGKWPTLKDKPCSITHPSIPK